MVLIWYKLMNENINTCTIKSCSYHQHQLTCQPYTTIKWISSSRTLHSLSKYKHKNQHLWEMLTNVHRKGVWNIHSNLYSDVQNIVWNGNVFHAIYVNSEMWCSRVEFKKFQQHIITGISSLNVPYVLLRGVVMKQCLNF